MTIPDNLKRLIERAELPALVLANDAFDIELVFLEDGLDGRDWRPRCGRPLECIAAFGIIDGVGRSALVSPTLDARIAQLAVDAYARHVQKLNGDDAKPETVDDAAWLADYYDRLYRV